MNVSDDKLVPPHLCCRLYLIKFGIVKVTLQCNGATIETLNPGDLFGHNCLLGESNWKTHAGMTVEYVASSAVCCIFLSRDSFRQVNLTPYPHAHTVPHSQPLDSYPWTSDPRPPVLGAGGRSIPKYNRYPLTAAGGVRSCRSIPIAYGRT